MDESFLDSFVSKMAFFSLRSQSKANIKILTTMSKKHFDCGKYVLSFDAFTARDESMITSVRTKRQQEIYEELPCIAAPCSGEFEVPLKDKKCPISFSVTGALQPSSPLEKGEDILEYSLTKLESRKILHLKPTFDTSSDGQAFIKFRIGEDVTHTVIIHDVPVTRPVTSLSASGSSASRLSESGSSASGFNDSFDGGTMRKSDRWTSEVEESVENLAIGEPPRTIGPTYVPPSPNTSSVMSYASEEYEDTAVYDKILSNTSLRNLVFAIPPQEASQLLIHLRIPDSFIKTMKVNNPGDISSANYECLLHWRNDMGRSIQDKDLFLELVGTLESIKRRDLASTLQTVVSSNRELAKSDFKNI